MPADDATKAPRPFDVRTIKTLVALMNQHDLSEIDLGLLRAFGLQLVEFVGLAHRVEQRFVEFVVGLKRALQVIEAGAQIKQLLQRLYLTSHLFRLEIFQALELQIHANLSRVRVLTEFVFHREREVRLHAF